MGREDAMVVVLKCSRRKKLFPMHGDHRREGHGWWRFVKLEQEEQRESSIVMVERHRVLVLPTGLVFCVIYGCNPVSVLQQLSCTMDDASWKQRSFSRCQL